MYIIEIIQFTLRSYFKTCDKTSKDWFVGPRPLCSVNEWLINVRMSEHQKVQV